MKIKIRNSLSILTICAGIFSSRAQPSSQNIKQYINQFKEDAILEMQKEGIPASITLAQGIQESNAGNSPLALHANNHFGIKCAKDWSGPYYTQDDDTKDECFRKYENAFDSYSDHSAFLKSHARYAYLFQIPITDYKGWANGLKASGYASDPLYAKRLIKIIEDYQLYYLDTIKSVPTDLIASIDNYFDKQEAKNHKKTTSHEVEKYILPYSKREIELINGRKCIHARTGETIDEISSQYDIDRRLIYRYNELENNKKIRFKPGMIVFLQPKRNKGKEDFHTVASNETMYTISQKYGIKLKKLYKKNRIKPGSEPDAGTVLWLRKNKKR